MKILQYVAIFNMKKPYFSFVMPPCLCKSLLTVRMLLLTMLLVFSACSSGSSQSTDVSASDNDDGSGSDDGAADGISGDDGTSADGSTPSTGGGSSSGGSGSGSSGSSGSGSSETSSSSAVSPSDPATDRSSATGSGTGTPSTSPTITLSGCGTPSFSGTPVDIGTNLQSLYEPSDADFHEGLDKILLVSDEGTLTILNYDGSNPIDYTFNYDLEGITVADPSSPFVYIGVEDPDSVVEFNIVTGTATRWFNLTGDINTGPSNQGLEALTFVPNDTSPEGGYFYVGHQYDGEVFVFELPIVTSSTSTSVSEAAVPFYPYSGRSDIAGMDYDPVNNNVIGIYDGANKITVFSTAGARLSDGTLPQTDQEGYARSDNCEQVIAQDTGKIVWFYEGNEIANIDNSTVTLLANRIDEVQNDDGSFDWQQDVSTALTPTTTGYQNVTGVSAWGLFEAQDLLGSSIGQTVLDNVITYFDPLIDNLIATPADITNNLSCPNWTFIAEYLSANPDATLEAKTISGLDALLDSRDTTYGDDSTIRVDGLFNRILTSRSSIPGLIPWDMALCVEALQHMKDLDSSFDTDYEDGIAELADYTENIFLPAFDADNGYEYADLSLALPLFVLHQDENSYLNVELIAALEERLETLVDADGQVSNGSTDDDPRQASAYALLAFKEARNAPYAQLVQDYLEGEVDASGRIVDATTNLETFEVDGEVLRALAFVP